MENNIYISIILMRSAVIQIKHRCKLVSSYNKELSLVHHVIGHVIGRLCLGSCPHWNIFHMPSGSKKRGRKLGIAEIAVGLFLLFLVFFPFSCSVCMDYAACAWNMWLVHGTLTKGPWWMEISCVVECVV